MKVELLTATAPRWTALLERVRHDFYHLPSYARVSAAADGGDVKGLLVEEGGRAMLLPLVSRAIAGDARAWDATSPYGYPGPLVEAPEGEREAFATAAFEAARGPLREEGCVSIFARLHPLLGPIPRPAGAAVVQHGETVPIDLTRSDDELWKDTMSGHRNEINRAVRAGHRASIDEGFIHLRRFVDIYRETMSRVGASAYYFFDLDYVVALREALGSKLKIAVVEIGDVVAAAGLFVETCGIVQYHLSGTDPAFLRERPTKLMLHHVRTWAKARGNTVMHLGGGLGGAEDSLFKFKAGFSKLRTPFHTLRMVVDPDAFRSLSVARHPELQPASLADLGGFFPAYRRP